MPPKAERPAREGWTLITNHGVVLLHVAQHPHSTVRQAAVALGLSSRTVLRILADLAAEGYIEIGREGRRNWYSVAHHLPMRRPEMRDIPVTRFLKALASDTPAS